MRWAAALAALAVAGTAHGASHISIAPLGGDPEPALVGQLEWELCDAFGCEPWYRVSTEGSPDIAKARREGVAGIMTGVVAKPGGRSVLSLSFLTRSRSPSKTWRFKLNRRGALDRSVMQRLIKDLETYLGGSARAPHERVHAPPPPAPRVTPPTRPTSPTPPTEEALGLDLTPGREQVTPPPPQHPPPPLPPPPQQERSVPLPPPPLLVAPAVSQPKSPPATAAGTRARATARSNRWLAVELGLFAARRELRFENAGLGAAQLRGYSAPAITGPQLRLEVFPAAPFTDGLAAGAGLFASYGLSIDLKTRTDAGETRSSELSRLALGATWRSPPLSSLRIVVAPSLSYQSLKAVVEPAIPGLADARLSGFKGGLDLELGSGRTISFLLGGGFVKWTTAQDLIKGSAGAGSVAFFPGGSASAVELDAGFSVAILGSIALRMLAEYSSTHYAFDADPSGVFVASGAKDTYLGARLLLRASY